MTGLSLRLPDEALETIAKRAAELLYERLQKDAVGRALARQRSEFLTVDEAADLLRADRQRVYDLRSAGRLSRYSDGSRALVRRAELEAHLAGEQRSNGSHPVPTPPRSRMGKGRAA